MGHPHQLFIQISHPQHIHTSLNGQIIGNQLSLILDVVSGRERAAEYELKQIFCTITDIWFRFFPISALILQSVAFAHEKKLFKWCKYYALEVGRKEAKVPTLLSAVKTSVGDWLINCPALINALVAYLQMPWRISLTASIMLKFRVCLLKIAV